MSLDPNAPILVNPQDQTLFEVYDEKQLKRMSFSALADSLSDYVENSGKPYFNVKQYGAIGNGLTNDTNAIKSAIAAAGNNGTVYFPDGDYYINDTIQIVCNVASGHNSRLLCNGGSPAVRLGNTTNVFLNKEIRLPKVINQVTPYWTAETIGTNVGVEIKAFYACDFYIPYVSDFDINVKITGNEAGNGFSYNRIYFGILYSGAINLYIYPDDTGWVNENWFFGGRYQQSVLKGVNLDNVYQIRIDTPLGNYTPNNNNFFGLSVEGSCAGSAIWCKGFYNQFFAPRFEANNTAITWGSDGSVHARFNTVYGGVGVDENAVFVSEGNARENTIYRNTRLSIPEIRLSKAAANGPLFLQNSNSSSNPSATIFDTTVNLETDDLSTGWSVRLGAALMQGKLKTDTNPRLQLDFANGTIGVGAGGASALNSLIDYGVTRDTFTFNKEIEFTDNGDGIYLKSPNGTLYKLSVANGGTISITAV